VFGGTFTSRINMNLRDEKGWSYGVNSFAMGAKGQRPWIISAPVQLEYTTDSIRELIRELEEFTGENPASEDEVEKIRANRIRSLPGRFETGSAVLGAVSSIVSYGWPDDHVVREQQRIEDMSLETVRAATRYFDLDALTWVIVGDLSKIEQPVRELELGEVVILDADGQML
jgi:zinc protease